ncbi:MAG: hydroxymethylglutaryl-CoA lyase [SAR324 cluster bacterium]|nr:hydroxymethylglutaryl-CoA lyase [SAR324 cluster bacterium]
MEAAVFDNLPKKVYIREVGPRDGLQIEPEFVPTEVKAEFIRKLAATGVPHIEITSFVHPKWIPALADGKEIGGMFAEMNGTHTSALVPNMRGLEGAAEAGLKEVSVFMSASESHNKANINRAISESLKMFSELIPAIKKEGMGVIAAISVVCGCPFEGEVPPEKVAEIAGELVSYGADYIMLGDTIGVGTPIQVKRLLEKVMPLHDPQRIGLHLHDTQATALSNVLAGLEMGIACFDGAVGGLGGCPYAPGASGNLPTENLVYLLHGMGIETGIDLDALLEVADWCQRMVGHSLSSNGLRAYLGRKAAKKNAAEKNATGAHG